MRRWKNVFCLIDVGGSVLKERDMSRAKKFGGRKTNDVWQICILIATHGGKKDKFNLI